MDTKHICVIVDSSVDKDKELSLSARPSLEDIKKFMGAKTINICMETLSQELNATFLSVIELLTNLPRNNASFELRDVSFTLAVDSGGKISLLSAIDVSIGAKVGFTFTLRKK